MSLWLSQNSQREQLRTFRLSVSAPKRPYCSASLSSSGAVCIVIFTPSTLQHGNLAHLVDDLAPLRRARDAAAKVATQARAEPLAAKRQHQRQLVAVAGFRGSSAGDRGAWNSRDAMLP